MNRYKIFFIFLAVLLISGFSLLPAEDKLHEIVPDVPPDAKSPVDTLFGEPLTRIIEATVSDNFDMAVPIVDSLQKEYPDEPAPYFFEAALLQNWMSTLRINQFEKEVEENVQIVIDKGSKILAERNDPWVHFYLGGAYGYRGFARFRKWNFIGAYKDASKGIDHFKKLLEIDSTVYDVYLGLGSYYYWRTAKSSFIRIIAFWMSDKRELGIEQLKFTIKHGRYAPDETIYVLLATYYDAKRFEEARELVNYAISKKGFANLTDLYFKGRVAAVFQDWPEVESAFSEILSRIENYKYPSIGYQVECKYWIAKAKGENGELDQALQLANQALELSKQRNEDMEIEGHIDSFKDIKKSLEELFKDLNKMALKGSL